MRLPLPILALPLIPGLAAAQATGTAPDMGSSLLELGFGFALVLALLFGSLWLLKRLTAPRGQSAGLIKIVATQALGPRERAVLVEVGEQWLLLGVTPSQVSTLAEVPRQALPQAPQGPAMPEFAAWLKRALEQRNGPKS